MSTYTQSEVKEMSLGFGSKSESQSQAPLLGTRGSSITGSKILLDPEVQRLRSEGLFGLTKAAGDFGGQISQLQQSAFGNLPDYIQSMLSPLQQNIAQQQGQLSSNLARRGLGGSSFGQQAMRSQAFDAQRALQDARAQAIGSGTGQVAGLAQQQFGAGQAASQAATQAAQDLLRQELGLLSLSKKGQGKSSEFGLGLNL